MDKTTRMAKLLGELITEKHGLVADTMNYHGKRYGMNYGVNLYTIRAIAKREGIDHTLAKYLYRQQIREMQLLAISMADAAAMDAEELKYWADGLTSSELAEEFALKILPKVDEFWELFEQWLESDDEMVQYSAMMGGSRVEVENADMVLSLLGSLDFSEDMPSYIINSAILLLVNIAKEDLVAVRQFVTNLPENSTSEFINEELEWRLFA